MAFSTITNQEILGLGVSGLPDTPELTAAQMQEQFDEYPKFLKGKFIEHIEEEEADTAASNIGAVIPSALRSRVHANKIQAILDGIAAYIRSVENDANGNTSNLSYHTGDRDNPHGVTKEQIGLGNVPNVSTDNQTPKVTTASVLKRAVMGDTFETIVSLVNKAILELINHLAGKNNPHEVTKAQIGLGNVDNTSDADKPISTAMQTALDAKADIAAVNQSLSSLDSAKASHADVNAAVSAAYQNVISQIPSLEGYARTEDLLTVPNTNIDFTASKWNITPASSSISNIDFTDPKWDIDNN